MSRRAVRDGEDGRRMAPRARSWLRGLPRVVPPPAVLLPRGDLPRRAVVVRLALALALAAFLWVRVSADTDPVRTLTYDDVTIKAQAAARYSLITALPVGTVRVDGLQSGLRDARRPGLYVDLTGVTSTDLVTVPVRVRGVPAGAQVAYSPRTVRVRLQEEVTRRGLPVQIIPLGQPPPGYLRPDVASAPPTVTIRGPSGVVNSVVTVRLTTVDEGVTQDTTQDLVPGLFDRFGRSIAPGVVRVSPPRITVMVRVRRQPFKQLVPVVADLRGNVAPGYGIANITVFPQFVQALSGSPLSTATVATTPIAVTGWTGRHILTAELIAPPGVTLPTRTAAVVTVEVAPVDGSGTTVVGVRTAHKRPGTTAALDPATVTLSYGGPLPALRAAASSPPVAVLDLGNRQPGVYHLAPAIALPPGLRVLALSPPALRVVITAPPGPRPHVAPVSPTARATAPTRRATPTPRPVAT